MVNATRGRALFPGVDLGVFKGSGLVLWATASRVPRDSCQVTTAVSPAEGSHHFVGQVGGTGGPPVGVLAGREG